MISELRQEIHQPTYNERHRNAWISDDTCMIVDMRLEERRNKIRDQRSIHEIIWRFGASLQTNLQDQADTEGMAVHYLLT